MNRTRCRYHGEPQKDRLLPTVLGAIAIVVMCLSFAAVGFMLGRDKAFMERLAVEPAHDVLVD